MIININKKYYHFKQCEQNFIIFKILCEQTAHSNEQNVDIKSWFIVSILMEKLLRSLSPQTQISLSLFLY